MSAPECCSKICNKNFLKAAAIVFVVLLATDYLIHGVLLKSLYQQTAALWRPEPEMKNYCVWIWGGQAIIALLFTRIFAHGHQNKGIKEGICFGLMMSVFVTGHNLIMYAVAPWTLSLIGAWAITSLVQSMLLGAAVAKFYKA